jgi:hypothetical protein
MIPEAVFNEVESELARMMVSKAEWIKKVKVHHPDRKSLFRIPKRESSVIQLPR